MHNGVKGQDGLFAPLYGKWNGHLNGEVVGVKSCGSGEWDRMGFRKN